MPAAKLKLHLPLLILTLLGLGCGIVWIFQLSFRPGSLYPAYSSLRSDPLGTKLFYHSLGSLPDLRVSRSHLPLTQVDPGTDEGVFFLLGVNVSDLDSMSLAEAQAMEKWLDHGWRLVFALKPEQDIVVDKSRSQESKKVAIAQPLEKGSGTKESVKRLDYYPRRKAGRVDREKHLESAYFKQISLLNRWDIKLDAVPFMKTGQASDGHDDENTDHLIRVSANPDSGLEGEIPFFSETVVSLHSKDWRSLYEREGRPVVLERKFGRGSVVFVTDTYAFSNQSLAQAPALSLLDWCLGGRTKVIFDESHHGLTAAPGVMSLARTLRLEGFFGGLLILALLLIWRASRSFPPMPADEEESRSGETASPRDQLDGLANLLQRGLPSRDLLAACLKEWKLSSPAKAAEELPADSLPGDDRPASVLRAFNRLNQQLNQKIRP